jgi:hypothetical protein
MVLGISGAALRELNNRAKRGDQNARNRLRHAGRKAKSMMRRDPRGTHLRAKQHAKRVMKHRGRKMSKGPRSIARARAQKAAWRAKQAVKRVRWGRMVSKGPRSIARARAQKVAWRAKRAGKIGKTNRGMKSVGGFKGIHPCNRVPHHQRRKCFHKYKWDRFNQMTKEEQIALIRKGARRL